MSWVERFKGGKMINILWDKELVKIPHWNGAEQSLMRTSNIGF